MPALKWFLKIYGPTGTFKQTVDSSLLTSNPTVVREVGKPASDVSVTLAVPFDKSPVSAGDRVKLYCLRTTNPDGSPVSGVNPVLYYQGNAEEPTLSVDQAGRDNVEVRMFPIDALMNRTLWKKTAYAFTLGPEDPSAMIGEAVDDLNAVYGSVFSKALTSSAQLLTLAVEDSRHLQAIQNSAALLPSGWQWRVEPDGTVRVRQWPATATHSVTFAKQVDSITCTISLLNTVNHVVVKWGSTYSEYSDLVSIAAYGKRTKFVNDPSVTTLSASDARGASELAASSPTVRTVVVVNSFYLNETIQPGDTVKILNIPSTLPFSGINRIVRVEYDGSLATLHLAEVTNNFSNELRKFINA